MNTHLLQVVLITIAAPGILLCLSRDECPETFEIALSNLIGLYDTDGVTSRLNTFQLSKYPRTVDNAWIRLAGLHQTNMYCCDNGAV